MSREISEDRLRGVAEALTTYAPHLLPKIYHLIRGGLVDGPEGKLGSSACGKLTTTISWEDGGPILRALEAIERVPGFRTLVYGQQINLLICDWRHFAEPKQLPPQT